MTNDDTVDDFCVIGAGLLGIAATKIVCQAKISVEFFGNVPRG